ncbi:LysM peptidoglycan-binding domain-containing protein [Aquabacterium sp. OR-4]|uniref:LysM peptidoglycan-binding domain-containing protein n=1 Tax=Aquabacterium sp. OR-4 TaxID=2978127 RepID=UPI0028C86CE1|nr:LysM peptidoglycan-binding domain-containing protein [Aquabacterium sp. OR-4]MDT7838666.1 LysM peptidoglycan-binding domain-containing protein [Aquabacterium sp. OR-4]
MSPVQTHRVQRGDTLSDIARSHGVAPEALMRANGLDPALADGRMGASPRDPDRLQVGQRLLIPVATPGLERQHEVAPDETLAGIAERWGVALMDLLRANLPFLDAAGGPAAPAPAPTGAVQGAAAAPTAAVQGAPAATPASGRLDLQAFTDPALGSHAAAAIVIGSAEGTRRPDGGFTPAYGGHADPGNAAHNRGSFSYQHAASSPADADRRQLASLRATLPAYEAAAQRAGLDPADARLASAYLDLYNQSPSAARRFVAQLGTLSGQPLDSAHLTQLRVNSFVDASTGQRFELAGGGQAGSGFANIARARLGRTPTEAEVQNVLRADQQRRMDAIESALGQQGLLAGAPAAAAPAAAAPAGAAPAGAATGTPRHLDIALGELGTREIRGAGDNPRVVEYHQATSLRARDDETSWCSSFVNWTMQRAGVAGTDSAAARSWLQWGQAVPRDAAHVQPGDVIVFPRGNNPAQGHVAIVSEVLADGQVRVVGGNQRGELQADGTRPDAVTESVRRLDDALGVRRAP